MEDHADSRKEDKENEVEVQNNEDKRSITFELSPEASPDKNEGMTHVKLEGNGSRLRPTKSAYENKDMVLVDDYSFHDHATSK